MNLEGQEVVPDTAERVWGALPPILPTTPSEKPLN
jgi:hypothetical protein